MENRNRDLVALINPHTTGFGRAFLAVGLYFLTSEHRRELNAAPPVDDIAREQAISAWVERLEIIRRALKNFPTLESGSTRGSPAPGAATRSRRHSATASRSPASLATARGSPARSAMAPGSGARRAAARAVERYLSREDDTPRPSDRIKSNCHKRDQNQCIITGRKTLDGWNIQVAHIMPYALACNPQCRRLDFWLMMELFYGVATTDKLFATLLANINSMDNLICLDVSVHSLFDRGRLTLTPFKIDREQISMFSGYRGPHLVTVNYPQGMSDPALIPSRNIWGTPGALPLVEDSQICIQHYADMPNEPRTPPKPAYFAWREYLVRLEDRCSRRERRDESDQH